jgi:hypothetical protein
VPIRELTADYKVLLYRWWLYANGYLFVGISFYNYRVKSWIGSLKTNPNAAAQVSDEPCDGG